MSVALSPLAAKTFPIALVPLRRHAATFLNPTAEIVSPQCPERIAGKPHGANGNSATTASTTFATGSCERRPLGAHTGFCDQPAAMNSSRLITFQDSRAMWRSNLNSIGPRGIFPGAANTVVSSSISTPRYVSGLRFWANFRDGSPIASLRRWSRSYCGANGLMKRSSTPGCNSRC